MIGPDNILFASEMLGAVRGTNPDSGFPWDDTKRYVDKLSLDEAGRAKVFELNARRVYPRLTLPACPPASALPAPACLPDWPPGLSAGLPWLVWLTSGWAPRRGRTRP